MFKGLKSIYDKIKNLNKSIDTYKDESIVQSLPTVAYVNRAKKFVEEGNYEEAKKVLLAALDISKQDYLVYKYLGRIYENEQDFKNAIINYERVIALNPNDKDIYLRYGMVSLYSDKFEVAINSFEKAEKLTPNNSDVYTGWGMALMRMKKYALARDKFVLAAQLNKYNFTAILLSAVMESRIGEYSSAEDKLRFLIKVAPNESSNYEYAKLRLIQEYYDEAIEYANKSIAINNKMLPAYYILAEVYSIQNNSENTHEVFKIALENGLECSLLYFEWGKACVRLFDFELAQEKFNKALELENSFVEAKIGLALTRAYKNDFVLLNELKERHLDNVYIQEGVGLLYMSENRFEEAIEMFDRAIKTDKNQTYNFLNIAKAYAELKNNYKVREYYDKFLENNTNNLKGLVDYSKWLISVSDYEEAQRKLRRAEKIDSNNIEVVNLLFFVSYTLVKNNVSEYNIREAISIANRAIDLGQFDYTPQKQELEDVLKNLPEGS